jgi:hypothetical protein
MIQAAVAYPYIKKTLGVLETPRVFAFVGEVRFKTYAHQRRFIPLPLRPLHALFPRSLFPPNPFNPFPESADSPLPRLPPFRDPRSPQSVQSVP